MTDPVPVMEGGIVLMRAHLRQLASCDLHPTTNLVLLGSSLAGGITVARLGIIGIKLVNLSSVPVVTCKYNSTPNGDNGSRQKEVDEIETEIVQPHFPAQEV